ncbi:MAG: hypothetical protein P8Y54_03630 [Xanthomonadales bacterium]
MTQPGKRLSPRVALVVIAALFVLPLAAAWLMYSGVIDFTPGHTRNLGELVEPPVPVDLAGLEAADPARAPTRELPRHWTIIHRLPAPCGPNCEAVITALRQIHRAAGRDRSRLRILLVHGPQTTVDAARIEAIHPAFLLAVDTDGRLLDTLAGIAGDTGAPGHTYLMDPLGNIMMFYRAGYDPNDLKKDLERLLTWSKLDDQ